MLITIFALAWGVLLIGSISLTTYGQVQQQQQQPPLFNQSGLVRLNDNASFNAGIAKGHTDREACEAAEVDLREDCEEKPVGCPPNYNATQCATYQHAYTTVFQVEDIFSKFYEGLGKGMLVQQAYGQFGIEDEKQELIQAAKEWNTQTLEILDECYPPENFVSESSRIMCDEMLVDTKKTCDERKEQITKDNTPACDDPRIDSYIKVRKLVTTTS